MARAAKPLVILLSHKERKRLEDARDRDSPGLGLSTWGRMKLLASGEDSPLKKLLKMAVSVGAVDPDHPWVKEQLNE